jgi:hypothetical protein
MQEGNQDFLVTPPRYQFNTRFCDGTFAELPGQSFEQVSTKKLCKAGTWGVEPTEKYMSFGCWHGAGYLQAIARALNIPCFQLYAIQSGSVGGVDWATHVSIALPSLGLLMVRCDHLWTPNTRWVPLEYRMLPFEMGLAEIARLQMGKYKKDAKLADTASCSLNAMAKERMKALLSPATGTSIVDILTANVPNRPGLDYPRYYPPYDEYLDLRGFVMQDALATLDTGWYPADFWTCPTNSCDSECQQWRIPAKEALSEVLGIVGSSGQGRARGRNR